MANAKKATLSLVVIDPKVTSIDDVRAEFKEIGLEDIEPATMEAVCLSDIEALRAKYSQPYNRCQAARRNPDGVLNAVRCGGHCHKGTIYYSQHFGQDLAYQKGTRKNKVVKFVLSLRRRLQAKRFLVQLVAASMVYHSGSRTWRSLSVLQALHLCRRRMMPENDIVHIETKRGVN